jgi:nitrite reductase/ring-hydroxylating ferredoxin subunit
MAWIKIGASDELLPGSLMEVIQNGQPYAVCNVEGEFRAISGTCPHHGGPLGQGAMEGSLVTCPWHSWQFESSSGECMLDPTLRLRTYPVRVEENNLLVDLP